MTNGIRACASLHAPVPVLGLAVTFLIFYFSFIMYVSVAIFAQAKTELLSSARHLDRLCTMHGIWVQTDGEDKITYVTSIILHKEKIGKKGRYHGITFNGHHRPWGRWLYLFVDPTGLLLLEFAAGAGYPRRHVLVQVDAHLFELAKDHPLYAEEELWSKKSLKHTNTKRTFFQKWNPHKPCQQCSNEACASEHETEMLGESSASERMTDQEHEARHECAS